MQFSSLLAPLAVAASVALVPGGAGASESRFGKHDIQTLFAIGKNVDRNEVQYGIRLDQNCVPYGNAPVYAYWRQYEEGPTVTEDLNMLDRTVYGIKSQAVVKRSPEESKVLMTIKATDRPIAVVLHQRDGKCIADPIAVINGSPARLERVFVHVKSWLNVDYIEIKGSANGKAIVEHVKH
jgi:hypothetical protein